jgi:Transposase DDE domain group 1
MPTQCRRDLFGYEVVEGRQVVAAFDGGEVTSDAGALLLGATDRAIGLVTRFAACFDDGRVAGLVEHSVAAMVAQRVFGIALGYEDLIDHDQLRHDPVLATLAGKLTARRKNCAPLAGKSTLNRLEHAPSATSRYHKIGHDPAAIEGLFVDLFLGSQITAPRRIILDLDATDDPLHGHQEGRFFHGYYDCYCYLPLYVFCGRHLLAAKLRRSNIDASAGAVAEVERIVDQIRMRWPRVTILLRADSGFAREALMSWCEVNGVDYLFGLARNERLVGQIADDLAAVAAESLAQGGPARRFADFVWSTLDSWSRQRRVVAKAEHLTKGSNPRFVVTSLPASAIDARGLYEDVYCARGEVENRMYGRLPRCKRVSSSFRHAWSAAAMYPALLGGRPLASMRSAS